MDYTSRLRNLAMALKVCNRDYSNKLVYDIFNNNKKEFSGDKNNFSLNTRKIIEYLSGKEGKLLMDYTQISHDMKIIDRPYNLIYNYASKNYEPCLVILFIVLLVDNEIYPINTEFWISETMIIDDEIYRKKTEIAEEIIENLLNKGMKIDRVLFDAGFNVPDFISFLNRKQLEFTARISKTKKMDNGKTIKELFSDKLNGEFYYYHKYGFTNYVDVEYAGTLSRLVVICDTSTKLKNRDFYCILSSSLDISYTETIRIYSLRCKIETFFRNLKSYIGLSSPRNHNEDKITSHINFCLAMHLLVQHISKKKKLTFHKALIFIKREPLSKIIREFSSYWKQISEIFVFPTFEELTMDLRFAILAS